MKNSSEDQEIMTRLRQVRLLLSEVEKRAIPHFPKADPNWCKGVKDELREIIDQALIVMEPLMQERLKAIKEAEVARSRRNLR